MDMVVLTKLVCLRTVDQNAKHDDMKRELFDACAFAFIDLLVTFPGLGAVATTS